MRLIDFGSARQAEMEMETMTISLKEGYAPIEQYQGKGQGPWTDVYALSATIYYCLTGQRPPQAMDRMLEDELIPPQKLDVNITSKQQKALLRGMEINPKRRYQSMEELHQGLYGDMVNLHQRREDADLQHEIHTETETIAAKGWLTYADGELRGASFPVLSGFNSIGRNEGNIILSGDQKVSRKEHGVIFYDNEEKEFFIRPMNGKEIAVNDHKVSEKSLLQDGDEICIGNTNLIFRVQA